MEIKYNPNSLRNGEVEFYENGVQIMGMGGMGADLVWTFYTSDVITITPDMEVYDSLKTLMDQEYEFNDDDDLPYSKTADKLVWYSDLGYRAEEDEISYLTIERKAESFELICRKQLFEELGIKNRMQTIAFRPAGNGYWTKNNRTGLTLQTDFGIIILNPLYEKYQKLWKKQQRQKTYTK